MVVLDSCGVFVGDVPDLVDRMVSRWIVDEYSWATCRHTSGKTSDSVGSRWKIGVKEAGLLSSLETGFVIRLSEVLKVLSNAPLLYLFHKVSICCQGLSLRFLRLAETVS